MTLRASTSVGNAQSAAVTSIALTVPTSGPGGTVAAGDVAVIVAEAVSTNGATLPTPAGWTLASGPHQIGATSALSHVFLKTLTAGDLGGTITLTYTGPVRAMAVMDIESDVTASGATVTVGAAGSASGTVAFPAASALAGAAVLALMPRRNGGTPAATVTLPSAFTQVVNIATSYGSAAEATIAVGRLTAPSDGTYGGGTGSTSPATTGTPYLVVLPPAVGAPATSGKILTAEGVANGTALVTGGSYGGDPVDVVAKTAGGGMVVSNAAGKMGRGSNSVRVTTAAATDTAVARFAVPSSPHIAAAFTYVADATPAVNTVIGSLRHASGAIIQIILNASGTLRFSDAAGADLWVTPGALPAGVPRIAVYADRTSSVVKMRVYANSTTTTPTYSQDVTGANLGTADFAAAQIGKSTTTAVLNAHYDDFRVSTTATDVLPPEGASNTAPTANAGLDQTGVEPWNPVVLTGSDSDSDGTVTGRAWAQTAGSPTVTLTGSGASRTFTAPGTVAGTTLTFTYTVTDSGGATASDPMTVTVLPATERAVIGGVEVAMQVRRT